MQFTEGMHEIRLCIRVGGSIAKSELPPFIQGSLIECHVVSLITAYCYYMYIGGWSRAQTLHTCKRVWLHKSKFLGSLQNLKAIQYYGLVGATFRTYCKNWKSVYTQTVPIVMKAGFTSRYRTSKHH